MARRLAGGTASPAQADRLAPELCWSKRLAWDVLVAGRRPAGERRQGGKFGETLRAAIPEEFDGMAALARRYRYGAEPNAPLRGLGIVAPGGVGGGDDGDGRIVFAETKPRKAGGSGALAEAHATIDKARGEALPSRLAAGAEPPHRRDTGVLKRLLRALGRADPARFRIGAILEAPQRPGSCLDAASRRHAGGDLDAGVDVACTGMLGGLVPGSCPRVGSHA